MEHYLQPPDGICHMFNVLERNYLEPFKEHAQKIASAQTTVLPLFGKLLYRSKSHIYTLCMRDPRVNWSLRAEANGPAVAIA